MITIREVRSRDRDLIKRLTILHKRAFPSFFLTQLGTMFIRTLYSGYLEDKDSGIIVAEDNGVIIGFIAYSLNYSRFFKFLIRNHLVSFA